MKLTVIIEGESRDELNEATICAAGNDCQEIRPGVLQYTTEITNPRAIRAVFLALLRFPLRTAKNPRREALA